MADTRETPRRWCARLGACLLLVALPLVGVAASDVARTLSVDDVIELRSMGFDDEAIRAEIDASSGTFALTEADVRRLRAAGFSQSFIDDIDGRQARGRLDNDALGRMVSDGVTLEVILDAIAQSERAFDASPRALLDFSRRYRAPKWLVRVVRGAPLTAQEIESFAADGLTENAQRRLIDVLGVEASVLDTTAMLKLLKAGVSGDVVRHLREASPGAAADGVLARAGDYPHPLGLFRLRYPARWHLLKEIDGDTVAYVVTPEAGVVRADDVNVAVQVMVMPVDAESVVADMTAAQALEQVLPIVLQQEPGLERVGAVREVRLGDLPAAALRLRGSLKSKAGRFAGDVTVGFRDGLMAFVVTLAPEAEAEVHAKAFADVLRQSSFLARTPVARRDSPVAAQKAVADHRASVVSILSYRDDEPFSAGTGFVVRDDGYVLTNHHVIWDAEKNQPATRFTVEWDADLGLARVDAQLVGYRHTSTYQRELVPGLSSGVDIALLKLPEGARYVPVSLVSAREVQLADPVLTLGFPARDKIQTVSTIVTSGIVTRFNKDFTGALESIYIDAPIAHGSSGGPALNLMVDRVFGLNTFGSFGIRGVEDLWNYFGVIPIDYALREFPLATRVVAARDGRLDTAELYDIALHSAAAGAVQGSLAIAERALSSAPDSADTNYLVGRLTLEQAVAQENVDAGLARLGRALELDADHLPSLSFLAQAYVQLGDPKRAQVYADRAVAAHPTDADALQVRALVFLAAKSYERALADLSKAKQLTQKVVPAPYLLAGETYYAMQRHDEGRREFEQASDIHPSNLPARLGVARYYTLTSQPVAALLEYSKIDRAQPGHPTVLAAIGRSYLAVDAPDKALASFLEAIDRARKLATLPTPDVYLGGAAAAQSAKVDKAGTAIALYLGLLSTYWGQDSAFDGHLGIARLLERDAGLRAIARGHVAWALDLRADDADAVALARKLGDARLSLEAIRAMVERLGYPPTLAGLVIRETPLDFAVEPTQQNMDELQKFLPGEVAVAIFLSQEKHRQPARGAVARTDTTAPVPAALAGVWATRVAGDDAGAGAAELVLALEPAGRYQIQIRRGGEVATEQGRFESDAGRLQFFSDGGEQSDYRYELRGRQLVLSSDESGTFVLDRVR